MLGQSVSGPFPELATISGVVVATLIVVEVLKRLFQFAPWFSKIPTWAVAVTVSQGLTVLAHYAFGALQGNIGELMWQSFLAAGTASGFYTWLRKPTATSTPKKFLMSWMIFIPFVCIVMGAGTGCNTSALPLSQQYALYSDTYSASLDSITNLSKQNMISLETLEKFNVVREQVNLELDSFRQAILEGRKYNAWNIARRVSAGLDKLIMIQIEGMKRRERTSNVGYNGFGVNTDRTTQLAIIWTEGLQRKERSTNVGYDHRGSIGCSYASSDGGKRDRSDHQSRSRGRPGRAYFRRDGPRRCTAYRSERRFRLRTSTATGRRSSGVVC